VEGDPDVRRGLGAHGQGDVGVGPVLAHAATP
jgi:hypothetical protein